MPGSQISWGLFPALYPWAMALYYSFIIPTGHKSHISLPALKLATITLAFTTAISLAVILVLNYFRLTPINLEGASFIRRDRYIVGTLRHIAHTAISNKLSIVSYPGMLSFNLFTNTSPPLGLGLTHWYSLTDGKTLDYALLELKADNNLLLVRSDYHLNYLNRNNLLPSSNIQNWLDNSFSFYSGTLLMSTHRNYANPITPMQVAYLTVDTDGTLYANCILALESPARLACKSIFQYTIKEKIYYINLSTPTWITATGDVAYIKTSFPIPRSLRHELRLTSKFYLIFQNADGDELDFATSIPFSAIDSTFDIK